MHEADPRGLVAHTRNLLETKVRELLAALDIPTER
jgi:hypothetical protein